MTTPSGDMPFLDHLEELRWRIIKCLAALIVCVGTAFAVVMQLPLIRALEEPILPLLHGGKLVYTHPGDAFQITLHASVILGLIFGLPIILYQLWAFMAPALYRHEKRLAMGVLFGATFLFVCGVALAYFVVLPLALPWLMGFGNDALTPMITASEYFDFAFSMALSFGIAFELPIVILALAGLGIVTPQMLNRYRRHAIVGVVIVGAFLTPGDLIWTTLAMAVPLYLLFEISVALSYIIYRRRQRAIATAGEA
jgi:sec-independent protein translocase protein TatC